MFFRKAVCMCLLVFVALVAPIASQRILSPNTPPIWAEGAGPAPLPVPLPGLATVAV